MTGLPLGWVQTTLDQVARWGSGGTPSRSNLGNYGGGIPWIKTGELGPRVVCSSEETLSEQGLANSSAKLFPKGAIAIAMYGATIGKTSILGIDATTNQACAVAIPDHGLINRDFLFHYLCSQREAFVDAGKGGAQPNISQGVIREWPVPIAPLPEQKRIADKLDTLLARVDACRERLARVPAILKRFRQSVLAAATSGELTREWREEKGIIFDWHHATLASIGNCTGGITKNSSRANAPIMKPYLRVANVYANKLSLDEIAEIATTTEEFARTRLQPGDVLIVEGNGSIDQIGRAALWRGEVNECAHQNHLIRWRSRGLVNPEFVLYWLLSPAGRESLVEFAKSSSGLHTLSLSKVSTVPLRVPSLEEQSEIVRRVGELLSVANQTERIVAAATSRVERTTQSTLAKAFRGELVPQDPNDEPASALLARVKAARESSPKALKPTRGRPRQPASP